MQAVTRRAQPAAENLDILPLPFGFQFGQSKSWQEPFAIKNARLLNSRMWQERVLHIWHIVHRVWQLWERALEHAYLPRHWALQQLPSTAGSS